MKSLTSRKIDGLLEKRLPKPVLCMVRKLGKLADSYGVSVYLVGGCVRDLLLGVKNLDLDIIVEGEAIKFAQFSQTKKDFEIVKHQKFGTATLKFPSGFKIDLASSRKEYYPQPAALPEVTFSNIQEDLGRRDFSINALAAKINPDDFGQLLDLFRGQKDLRQKTIRILYDQSFVDDPTRIVRAIRFEQRYNFKIESKTFKLMRKALALGLLERLTRFRLGREFILLLKEKKPLKAILRFEQLCGLKLIHPMIKLDKMVKARLKLTKPEDDWLVYFALLTGRLNEQQIEKLCCDFSLTRKDKQRLKGLKTKTTA